MDTLLNDVVRTDFFIRRRINSVLVDQVGVTYLQAAVIGYLYIQKSIGPSDLAVLVESDLSSISRLVTRLVEMGFAKKRADPADGRALLIELTISGRLLAPQIRSALLEAMSAVMSPLSERQQRRLCVLLQTMIHNTKNMKL